MTTVLPLPVSVDRVRMIRRSTRCFVFGLMGMVPLFGLGMAMLALRLRLEVAEEMGEPVSFNRGNKYSIAAFALAVVLLCFNLADPMLAMGIILPALQGYLLFEQYRQAEPLEWNPARHLVYWGAGLAYAGLALSSTIIMIGLWSAIRSLGR